jgi:hypothetical protein
VVSGECEPPDAEVAKCGVLITFNVAMLRRGIKRVILTPQNLGALRVLAVPPLPALLRFSGGGT